MRILLTFVLFLNLISAFAQNNDSLVYEFGDKLKVYKDLNSQTFRIKKNDKKVVFKKLKFIEHLGEYLQVLDKNNIPFYINNKGKKKKPLF